MEKLYEITIAKTTEEEVANALFLESKFPEGTHIVYGDNGICPGAETHASLFHKETLGENPEIAFMYTPADVYLSKINGTDKYVFEFGERIPASQQKTLVDKVKDAIEKKHSLESCVGSKRQK